MRGPLSVRIYDGTQFRTISKDVSGVKFSKTSNGGHRAASMRVNLSPSDLPGLGPSDRLWIDNAATGDNLFSGYTQNPTPMDGPAGQGFDLSALGGMITAADKTCGLIYVTKSLGDFSEAGGMDQAPSASVGSISADVVNEPALHLQFNPGQPIGFGSVAATKDDAFKAAAMLVGAVSVYAYSGKDDAGYRVEMTTPFGAVAIGADGNGISTAGAGVTLWVGPNFPVTGEYGFRLVRYGDATNIADDLTWSRIKYLSTVGQRMTRDGDLLYGPAGIGPATHVTAQWVVEDLLGRLLSSVDPRRAEVGATSMPIGQLAFPDGATAQRVLDELGDYETGMRWGIGSDDGLPRSLGGRGHEFWYRPLSLEPRYEITSADSYRQAGSETDLCNRVQVSWSDQFGVKQTIEVVATSADYPALKALEDDDRVRDADPIALPDGKGSANNALVIGYQALGLKASPPRSATAVLSRYVRDLWTGALVHPCEVEPGCLALVRSTGDLIEVTETEYDDDAASVTLTLGDPVPTDEQRFARLAVA